MDIEFPNIKTRRCEKTNDNNATNKWGQAMWTSAALDDNGVLYFGDYTTDFHSLQVATLGLAYMAWAPQERNLKITGW